MEQKNTRRGTGKKGNGTKKDRQWDRKNKKRDNKKGRGSRPRGVNMNRPHLEVWGPKEGVSGKILLGKSLRNAFIWDHYRELH